MINQQACAQTFANEAVARGVSYFVSQGEFGGLGQFGCGVAVVDLDGDGDDDIVCTGNAKDRLGFFRNGGAGQFSDVSAETGLGVILKASGIAAGDFDADGDLDLAVTRWLKATVLLRNDSTSSNAWAFVDVAAASGITGVGAGAGCAWGDYNGDGWIDLAVANRSGTNANLTRNKLWRNNNGTSFTEVAGTLGVDNVMFPAFMVTWCDIDLDGDADMYVANDKGSANPHFNRLYRNSSQLGIGSRQNYRVVTGIRANVYESIHVSRETAENLSLSRFVEPVCHDQACGLAKLCWVPFKF